MFDDTWPAPIPYSEAAREFERKNQEKIRTQQAEAREEARRLEQARRAEEQRKAEEVPARHRGVGPKRRGARNG